MTYDYAAIRRQYLPDRVRVVFVGESAPDPQAAAVRFFYHPVLSPRDNLFRGLMLALYGADRYALAATPKTQCLDRFKHDGYYLEDLCSRPVNHLPPAQRALARRSAVDGLVLRLRALRPSGIVICHQGTYRDAAALLRKSNLPMLHTEPIPFPLGNYRKQFADAVRAALGELSP